ncbi:MAG: hypothetical protein RBS57_20910, partial [Desulforhabdus sp.]|nr:hypothetical protein [Desulforhabdus sp.]
LTPTPSFKGRKFSNKLLGIAIIPPGRIVTNHEGEHSSVHRSLLTVHRLLASKAAPALRKTIALRQKLASSAKLKFILD